MSSDKFEDSEFFDLKALDSPEDEDFTTWDSTATAQTEPEGVQVQLNKFIGNNYEDKELGKLQRGEVVTVSEQKAEELLAVRASNGKHRFSRL